MRRSHRGFTLVELLVVIAIIGMLAGLLLPAIQRAREAGRNAQCANSLKQLGEAMIHYESTKSQIPGFVADINNASLNNGTKITVNWAVLLLPFISKNDVYNAIATGALPPTGVAIPRIDTFICPSALGAVPPPALPAGSPQLNYVANCGRTDNHQVPAPATTYPWDYQENGVFFNQGSAAKAINAAVPTATLSYINKWDGATNTVAFSENLDAVTWWPLQDYVNTNTTTAPYTYAFGYDQGCEFWSGIVWFGGTDTAGWTSAGPTVALNRNAQQGGNGITFARPSSSHINGFNMAFCDGRVSFVNENIQYRVYTLLMTPRGNAALDPIPTTFTATPALLSTPAPGTTTAAYTFSNPSMYTTTNGWLSVTGGSIAGTSTVLYAPGPGAIPPSLAPLSQNDLTP